MTHALSAASQRCQLCGATAEVVADRVLTGLDAPALEVACGPSCFGALLSCPECGHSWLVVGSDPDVWLGSQGRD